MNFRRDHQITCSPYLLSLCSTPSFFFMFFLNMIPSLPLLFHVPCWVASRRLSLFALDLGVVIVIQPPTLTIVFLSLTISSCSELPMFTLYPIFRIPIRIGSQCLLLLLGLHCSFLCSIILIKKQIVTYILVVQPMYNCWFLHCALPHFPSCSISLSAPFNASHRFCLQSKQVDVQQKKLRKSP